MNSANNCPNYDSYYQFGSNIYPNYSLNYPFYFNSSHNQSYSLTNITNDDSNDSSLNSYSNQSFNSSSNYSSNYSQCYNYYPYYQQNFQSVELTQSFYPMSNSSIGSQTKPLNEINSQYILNTVSNSKKRKSCDEVSQSESRINYTEGFNYLSKRSRSDKKENKFSCSICGKEFQSHASLLMHKHIIHYNGSSSDCPLCQKKLSSYSSALTHLKIHTKEKDHNCQYCQRSFTDSSTLNRHIRTHTGECPYKCHICKKGFTQKGNLTRHMKLHETPQINQQSNEKENIPSSSTPEQPRFYSFLNSQYNHQFPTVNLSFSDYF